MYILLVEARDLDQTESLASCLEDKGHAVGLAHTPEAAVRKTTALWPSLVVLNSSKGALDVADCQRALHKTDLSIPHLIVGGDELLNAPAAQEAITVTVDNLKQLDEGIQEATAPQAERFFRLPDLIVDFQERRVLQGEKSYSLTPKEFNLLRLLILNRDQIMSRKIIMQKVWDTEYMGDTRTLDVHIRWLREKIEINPSRPQHLITIRGVGYRFIAENDAAE